MQKSKLVQVLNCLSGDYAIRVTKNKTLEFDKVILDVC